MVVVRIDGYGVGGDGDDSYDDVVDDSDDDDDEQKEKEKEIYKRNIASTNPSFTTTFC